MAEKARVLVVDDDDEIRKLLQLTLEGAGFEVGLAADGQAGIAQMQTFKPHILLLDLVMPKLDGAGVLKWLSERGLRAGVVIMTAYWESADQSNLRKDRNVLDVWPKPLRYDDLKSDIVKLLLKHRLGPGSTPHELL